MKILNNTSYILYRIVMNYVDNSTKLSTALGAILTIFVNIEKGDIVKTMVLAVVGGMTSFTISLILKNLIKKINKNRKK